MTGLFPPSGLFAGGGGSGRARGVLGGGSGVAPVPPPPAVTVTLLTEGNAAATPSSATASVTPAADALQLLFLSYSRDGSTNPVGPSSITGNGLTWVQVGSGLVYDTVGTGRRACYLFRALAASPSSGAATITHGYSLSSASSVCWQWVQVEGVDTGGTNGSAAVVQAVFGAAGGTSITPSVDLAAFADAGNVTVGFCAFGADGDLAGLQAGSGFALLGKQERVTTQVTGAASEYVIGADTTVDFTLGTGSNVNGSVAVGLEVALAA